MTDPAQERELIERLREADSGSVQRSLGSRIFGEAADALSSRIAEMGRLTEALNKILTLRPAGDIDTAKNTRALVRQMEWIASEALDRAALSLQRRV